MLPVCCFKLKTNLCSQGLSFCSALSFKCGSKAEPRSSWTVLQLERIWGGFWKVALAAGSVFMLAFGLSFPLRVAQMFSAEKLLCNLLLSLPPSGGCVHKHYFNFFLPLICWTRLQPSWLTSNSLCWDQAAARDSEEWMMASWISRLVCFQSSAPVEHWTLYT